MDALGFRVDVFDPDKELLFRLNIENGFVIRPNGSVAYTGSNCTGDGYLLYYQGSCGSSAEGQTPGYHSIIPVDGWDFSEASSLLRTSGALTTFSAQTISSSAALCTTFSNQQPCGLLLVPTTELPTSFALPITIEPAD